MEKNEQKPLVSIIIPTYNRAKYLLLTLKSVLNQTYPCIEVIIVDDGSSENIKSIAEQFKVKYIRQNHKGAASAMNNGVEHSNGEFFISLASDDLLHPRYVEATMREAMTNAKVGFVMTSTRCFGESNEVRSVRKLHHRYSILMTSGQMGASLTRREAFVSVGGYDETLLCGEDWDFLIRLSFKGWKGAIVQQPIHFYRIHERQVDIETRTLFNEVIFRRYWFVKPYRKMVRLINAFQTFLRNPKVALWRFWNKILAEKFNLRLLREPSNNQHPALNEKEILNLIKGNTVLDCGCGIGRWAWLIKKKDYSKEIVGFDIDKVSLLEAKNYRVYDGLILASATHLPFNGSKSFDTVLAVELIEHLTKNQGYNFLNELSNLPFNNLIFSTPNNGYPLFYGENHPESHRSKWTEKELKNFGFKTKTFKWKEFEWLLCLK